MSGTKTSVNKISRSFSRIRSQGADKTYYLEGVVAAHECFVHVYSQKERPYTAIDFIHNGKQYWRSYSRFYTERGLAIMANKFVGETLTTPIAER